VGMVKIKVPAGWEPQRFLDPSKTRIKTEYQSVHELFYKDTVSSAKAFWASFNAYIATTNFPLVGVVVLSVLAGVRPLSPCLPLSLSPSLSLSLGLGLSLGVPRRRSFAHRQHRKKPVFNEQEVDLYRLYRVVEKRGGYDAISERKSWKEVAEALEIADKGNNAGSTLKQWYQKYLLPFRELVVVRNVGGAGLLADAVETVVFGSKTVAGVKREREGVLEDMDPRDVGAVVEGMLELIPKKKKEEETEVVVCEGEAAAADAAAADAAAGRPPDQPSDQPPGGEPTAAAPPPPQRESRPKKRPAPRKLIEEEAPPLRGDEQAEHSASENDEVSAMVCEACRGGHYEDQIILCDKCDKGWHMFCLKPKMKKIPKGDWICPACESHRRGVEQVNTQEHTLGEFQRRATDFERKWFAAKDPKAGGGGGQAAAGTSRSPKSTGGGGRRRKATKMPKVSDVEREREFWSVVDGGDDLATVICGIDPKVQIDRSQDGVAAVLAGGVQAAGAGAGAAAPKKKKKAPGARKKATPQDEKGKGAGAGTGTGSGRSGRKKKARIEMEDDFVAFDDLDDLDIDDDAGAEPLSPLSPPLDVDRSPEDHQGDEEEEEEEEVPKIGVMAIGEWKNDRTENLAPYCEVLQAPNGQSRKAMDSPMVEFGMTFSSRPWKVEDQLLYSATYVHSGAAKQWYCIPPYAASMYDAIVHKVHSEYMMSMEWRSPLGPNLMVNPTMLMERGVPVFGCKQEAGTLVVCFPNAYSCSVNLGFNISEMMPMVLPEWLRVSSQASSLYRNHRVAPRFSTEKMILNAIEGGNVANLGQETRYWLYRELARLVEEETLMRYKLWSEGLRQYRRIIDGEDPRKGVGQHRDQQECTSCGTPLVYSMVECACTPKVAACLHHRRHLCRCRADRQRLAWRYSVGELEDHVNELKDSLEASIVAEIEQREAALADDVQLCVEETAIAAKTSEELLREQVIEVYGEGGVGRKSNKRDAVGDDAAVGQTGDIKPERSSNPECSTPPSNGPLSRTTPVLSALSPSLTLVVECGYVQGPVRPFEHIDLPPEDFKSLKGLKSELEACCRKWIRDASATLEQGGNLVYELRGLFEEADEYRWATLPEDMRRQVVELVPKLVQAHKYVRSVERALNISNRKTLLEDVEKILNRDPLPIKNVPGIEDLEKAVDQGKEWIREHYEPVSDMTSNPPLDIKVFDNVLFEAGKIPVALQEAKILRERRDAIKRVAEAIRFALPKGRESGRRKGSDEPVNLDYIELLQQEAKKAHIMMPEIEYLNETLQSMQDWRRRVDKALADRSEWKVYEELIEEGKAMPVEMPDIHRLYALQDSVSAWIRGMHDLKKKNRDHKVPLKKLREFLAEGYALPLSFPEIQEMADYIQTFQVEDVAFKCLSSSVREEDVREVMDAIVKAGVSNGTSELSTGLKAKLEAADAWRARASTFSSRSVAALEETVSEGAATGLKMDLLDKLTERLAVVHRWIQRCNRCLSGVIDDPLRVPVIDPQRSPIVECTLPLMRTRVRFIDTKEREKFPSSTVIAALVDEYDELALDLPHYSELCALHKRAQTWLAEAAPILNQTEMTEDQVPLVESLVEKGLSTGVKIAQVDNLESYMNAFLWMRTAEELLEHFKGGAAAANAAAGTPTEANGPPASAQKLGQEALAAFIAAGDVFASCKHTSVAKGLKKAANVAARWVKEAGAVLREDNRKLFSLDDVVQLLENGKGLAVDVDATIEQVAELIARHDAIVNELKDVRSMDKDYSYLTERAAALMRIPIESEAKTAALTALKDMEKTWSAPQPGYGVRFATHSAPEALATMLSMLLTAQEQADRVERAAQSPLDSDSQQAPVPMCVCQRVPDAKGDAASRNGVVECDGCRALFHASCVNYGTKLPGRGRGRKSKKKAQGDQPNPAPGSGSKKQQRPSFVCSVCTLVDAAASPDKPLPLEIVAALGMAQFTTKEQLDALKDEVGGTRMFKHLSAEVDSVLGAAGRWAVRVQNILHRLHEGNMFEALDSSDPKDSYAATDALLRQLLLSTLAVGFDFTPTISALVERLRANRWRIKALELVSQSSRADKPVCTPAFLEETRKFLEEGTTAHNIDPSDPLYARIAGTIAEVDAWRDRAKGLTGRCVEVVEAHSPAWHTLRSEARRLIDADNLPWRIPEDDPQVAELKERLAVYCLCQKLYDDAPMLACDSCLNWFHFGCVGRREDPKLAKEIESWNCPVCFPYVGGHRGGNVDPAREENPKKRGRKKKKTDEPVGDSADVPAPPGTSTSGAAAVGAPSAEVARQSYQAHMPIVGPAKETLSTIERVLPALSKGLNDPNLFKGILEMYSGAPFQRAVLGNQDVPDEALAGYEDEVQRLRQALPDGAERDGAEKNTGEEGNIEID